MSFRSREEFFCVLWELRGHEHKFEIELLHLECRHSEMLLVIALFFLRLPESTAGEGTASEPDFIFMDVFPSALDLSGGFSALLKTFSLHNSRCFSNGSFNAFPRVSLKRFSFLWSKLDIILFLSLLLTKPGHFLSFLTSAVNYFWEVSSAVQLNKFPSCHSCVVFVRYGSLLFTPHSLSLWFFFSLSL